jgi:hypothetical protein
MISCAIFLTILKFTVQLVEVFSIHCKHLIARQFWKLACLYPLTHNDYAYLPTKIKPANPQFLNKGRASIMDDLEERRDHALESVRRLSMSLSTAKKELADLEDEIAARHDQAHNKMNVVTEDSPWTNGKAITHFREDTARLIILQILHEGLCLICRSGKRERMESYMSGV